MNRIRMAVVFGIAAVALACAPLAFASNGSIELNGGYAKSSDDLSGNGDKLGGGISFGGAYWRSATPNFSWGAEVSYDDLGSIDYDNGVTTDNKISAKALRLNPAFRFQAGRGQGPQFYAQGGLGFYNVSLKIEDSFFGDLSDSDAKFGFNAGVGFSVPVSPKASMVVNGLYHNVSMEDESLNYFQVKAGVGFGI
jgi:outer membrane protein with beta-barrel domain